MKKLLLLLILMILPMVASADARGRCGKNAFWNFEETTGTLTIKGSGDMADYEIVYHIGRWSYNTPWYNYRSNILKVIIEDGITSIGRDAFANCSSLTSITIPNSVTFIGDNAFSGCSGLTSITIPNSVTCIGLCTFLGCTGLTSIIIPNSLTDIPNFAFSRCSGLTSITIPNSVTSIGYEAFAYCSGLTSITIPNSVTGIRDFAFSRCSGLTTVILSQNIKVIEKSVFYECIKLESITIPPAVEYFYQSSFSGCENLKEITALSTKPPHASYNTFPNYNATLYVPEGYIKAYQDTYPWSRFATIKTIDGETNGVVNIPAKAVLIRNECGTIHVQGIDDGILVNVYNVNGTQVGSSVSQNGAAIVNTNLQPGSIAIVRIGEKSVKVLVK